MWALTLDVGLAVVLVLAVVLLYIFYYADADLVLLYKDRFGKRPESLQGDVVWITGASSGIGEYTAYHFARAGCRLVLSARRKDELDRVKGNCLKIGCNLQDNDILVLVLDSMDCAAHQDAVNQVLSHFKQIDILVNNAGKSQRSPWIDVELMVDRELFEINVFGPVSLTQLVLPSMIQRKKGHIVAISSIAGKLAIPHSRSYNGSKAAIQAYYECLRSEMKENNINVTVVCPGPVFSNLFKFAATGKYHQMLGREMSKTEKRMTTDKCAQYIVSATVNQLYEAWVSQHPWLVLLYFQQYFPDFTRWLLLKFGTTYLMKMREGN
ncbi:dehydrogenase/reductase SDR family member 7-like [Physella acuta]|uniref:dehydrogenase/reductase SDR family member 7-like n=1 Tax=Physella acuta TaxID=109671 RepID=UPI0027DB3369|nr:dehydrogenase/reductase SDR family member 7-like [Physella acuta]